MISMARMVIVLACLGIGGLAGIWINAVFLVGQTVSVEGKDVMVDVRSPIGTVLRTSDGDWTTHYVWFDLPGNHWPLTVPVAIAFLAAATGTVAGRTLGRKMPRSQSGFEVEKVVANPASGNPDVSQDTEADLDNGNEEVETPGPKPR